MIPLTSARSPVSSSPASGLEIERVAPLKDGDRIMVSGRPYKLAGVSKSDCAFVPPLGLPSGEALKFEALFATLCEIEPHIRSVSERQNDSRDGATLRFVAKLTDHLQDMPSRHQKPLRDYLFSLAQGGDVLQYPRNCVRIPPVSRLMLESILRHNAPELLEDSDYTAFMKVAYSPRPLVTQGYFLFDNEESEERFHEAILTLKPELRPFMSRLTELFEKGCDEMPLTNEEVDEYDQISMNYREAQRLLVDKLTASAPNKDDVEALSTRVTISIDDQGACIFSTEHYTSVFREELDQIADILARAKQQVPESAPDLMSMLDGYERWARTRTEDPNWCESISEWLVIDNPANVLDLNMCAEEIGSLVGKKGEFQFSLYQHAAVPESLKEMWENATQRATRKGIHLVMLSTLRSAGHTFTLPTLGENLPNAERIFQGAPLQRTMTFDNLTYKLAFEVNAESIRRVTNASPEDLARWASRRTAVTHVFGHEVGHTFDVNAEPQFLSKRTHVAETNAEGSALCLVAIYSPTDAADVGEFVACWMPCRRARQGLGSPHSQSDLALFDEYHSAGAVEIANRPEGGQYVRIVDQQLLENVAFAKVLQVRLWQRGVPLEIQEQWLEGIIFDRRDSDQMERVTADVDARISNLGTQANHPLEEWRTRVNAEVEAFFSLERMRAVKQILDPVLARLDAAQPLPVLPGNPLVERLFQSPN